MLLPVRGVWLVFVCIFRAAGLGLCLCVCALLLKPSPDCHHALLSLTGLMPLIASPQQPLPMLEVSFLCKNNQGPSFFAHFLPRFL